MMMRMFGLRSSAADADEIIAAVNVTNNTREPCIFRGLVGGVSAIYALLDSVPSASDFHTDLRSHPAQVVDHLVLEISVRRSASRRRGAKDLKTAGLHTGHPAEPRLSSHVAYGARIFFRVHPGDLNTPMWSVRLPS